MFIGIAGDSAAAVRKGVKQHEVAGCGHCTRRTRASRRRYGPGGDRRDQLGVRLETSSRRRGGLTLPRLLVGLDAVACLASGACEPLVRRSGRTICSIGARIFRTPRVGEAERQRKSWVSRSAIFAKELASGSEIIARMLQNVHQGSVSADASVVSSGPVRLSAQPR